ncbi:MAG: imelysin family protein [Flavobacteriaceae bacterium]|nr:imelysin family protein [Flavobacteriaceae bacterium]
MKNILFAITILLFISCGEDDPVASNTDTFDRAAMLTNWADNIIIPAYTDYEAKLGALKTATTTFTTTQNQSNLTALRAEYLTAYKTWQYVVLFSSIGKAAELDITRWVNVYPTSATTIETNITNGSTNLNLSSTNTQQGFPALDYLLYGVGIDDPAIVAKYSTANYSTYLIAVVDRLIALNTPVLNDWNGVYRNTFVTSSGNTVGSSVNVMVNDYIFNYEKYFRVYKLGGPLAIFGGSVRPEELEVYYGKQSRELCLTALDAIENFFSGKHYSSTTEGDSFKSYLTYLDTKRDGQALAPVMLAQMESARTKINLLNSDFATQLNTDTAPANTAYTEIQRLVPMLKIDMMDQAFNIKLDYIDNDGD